MPNDSTKRATSKCYSIRKGIKKSKVAFLMLQVIKPKTLFHNTFKIRFSFNKIILTILMLSCFYNGISQSFYFISGKVTENSTGGPIQNATIHLIGSNYSVLSKMDGTFSLRAKAWYDSLEISNMGYEPFKISLKEGFTTNLILSMKHLTDSLMEVVIKTSKKPGKSLMQKVIENKANNNPSRFGSFSCQRYIRNEMDIENIDFENTNGRGLKSLMLNAYSKLDSNTKEDKDLPIYFSERLDNFYHSISPSTELEYLVAEKHLGLFSQDIISKTSKYYFNFNIYNDWIPVFDLTFASPLNASAFNYYIFYEGSITIENRDTLQQIRFAPLHRYERAFSGTMWIDKKTLAVEMLDLHLTKTTNINFVSDIRYSEDYREVYDSISRKWEYMPYKYSSEVNFESGLALLGIPGNMNKNNMKFIIVNSTVIDKYNLHEGEITPIISKYIKGKQHPVLTASESFWKQNRLDSLSSHEINIYRVDDSLKKKKSYQNDVKLIAFVGTGYWDFDKKLRIGPYSSFISGNTIEGMRFRLGFWTMPDISRKINLFGYGAYGTKDQKLKGMIGLKYIWNETRWTKSTISYGSDYDFIVDQDDELDKDNIINSLLRKNIPFTRTYIKQIMLKHEQYISQDFTVRGSICYKELNPVFEFEYRPINPLLDKPFDNVFVKKLPVAEASIGIRYAHREHTIILNYDKLRLATYFPVLTANYTYGFEQGKALFEYKKVNFGIEQLLHLPPKAIFYYKLEVGKIYGTIPYLLLNIPAGNEFYVASKYLFNTMAPYEFAADRYISLHTRLYLGGTLFDKIPLLRKLGWRERISFNSYWGDMSKSNIQYNMNSNFNLIGKMPFMEFSTGIENIFHVLSIEWYRRLNYLNNPFAKHNGIYFGLTLSF